MNTLTNQEIFALNRVLEDIYVIPASFKFNYAIKRNRDFFRSALRSQPLYQSPTEKEYNDFLTHFKEISKGLAMKEAQTLFDEEISKEDFKIAKEQREKSIKEHQEKTKEWAEKSPEDLRLYKINVKDFPDGLTAEQFELIYEYLGIDDEKEKSSES